MKDRTKNLPMYIDTIVREFETSNCGSDTDQNGFPKYGVHVSDPEKILGWNHSVSSIAIEEVEAYLKKLKKLGCNRVAIRYHADHSEYLFTGMARELEDAPQYRKRKSEQLENDIRILGSSIKHHEDTIKAVNEGIVQKTAELVELKSKI